MNLCMSYFVIAPRFITQSSTHLALYDFEKEPNSGTKKVNQWFKTRTFMEATKTKNELLTVCVYRVCNEFIIKYFFVLEKKSLKRNCWGKWTNGMANYIWQHITTIKMSEKSLKQGAGNLSINYEVKINAASIFYNPHVK